MDRKSWFNYSEVEQIIRSAVDYIHDKRCAEARLREYPRPSDYKGLTEDLVEILEDQDVGLTDQFHNDH